MTLNFYLLVFLVPVALAAQGVVTGRVLDAHTGVGVANAEVYLGSSAQGLAQQSKTLSGPSGEFRFDAVLATDQYSFTVTKRTYLKASHPSKYQPAPFVIEPTGLTGITIRLMPQSVLSGVIVSEDGEALERITVLANVALSRHGQAILRSTDSSAQTDDLGRFRLYGLAAGDFVLTANTKELPGVFSVKAGEHRSGLNLVLSYPKTFSVQGRLTQPTVGYVFVRTIPFLNGGEVKKSGSFSIDRLTPGTYTLIADENSRTQLRLESAQITITNQNLHGVQLTSPALRTLTGRLRTEGPVRLSPGGVALTFTALHGSNRPIPVTTAPDGTFSVPSFPAGPYNVDLQAPPGSYVRQILRAGIPFDAAVPHSAPLEIYLSTAVASIHGTVEPPEGDGNYYAGVLYLVPEDKWLGFGFNAARYQKIMPVDLKFSLSDLAPGRYLVFVSEIPLEDGISAAKFRNLGAAMRTITLRPGQSLRLQLALIPPGRMAAAGIPLAY